MTPINIRTRINAPLNQVWTAWIKPEHITNWYFASEEWHAPSAINDLQVGGQFKTRMEAKDGSMGFDLEGTYTNVLKFMLIEYQLSDGRNVRVEFIPHDEEIEISQTFDPENQNPLDMQKAGWQAILDNFKKYVEKPS